MIFKEGDILQFCLNYEGQGLTSFLIGVCRNDVTDWNDSCSLESEDGSLIVERDGHRFNLILKCDNEERDEFTIEQRHFSRRLDNMYKDRPHNPKVKYDLRE